MSQGILGLIGTAIGVPLGFGVYFTLLAGTGSGIEGLPSAPAVGLVAVAAVAVSAAAAAIPAVLVERLPVNQALAAE